jgi:hypothetical protein
MERRLYSLIFRIALLATDSEKPRKEVLKCRHKAGKEKKGGLFRFTIEFDGQEPSLDDTSKKQELKDYARQPFPHHRNLTGLQDVRSPRFFSLN